MKKYILSRDGVFIRECNTESEIMALLHKLCPQSTEYALKYEGYKVEEWPVKRESYTVQPEGRNGAYIFRDGCVHCGSKAEKIEVNLRQCLGTIHTSDIGKRVYISEKGNSQVENQAQFEQRLEKMLLALNLKQ